ncbi:MAG: methyltransferase domain-containing protein, partial [Myxococcales bacterium]|nr:methyltransferase domain-containing protein [Myxococcales bacterium]
GRLGRLLRDRRGCDVTLVDVVDHNVTDLPFQVYDGRNLPLADQDRDRVIVMYVLHHAADDLAVLREARRVCRAGGRVLVAEDRVDTVGEKVRTIGFHAWLATFTFMGWTRFRKERAWRARFAEAGLRVEEVVPLGAVGALWPRNVLYVLAPA